MAKHDEITFGDEVRDKISGFKGVVVALTQWFNGCVRVTLAPTEVAKETGAPKEHQSFDVEQLEVIKKAKVEPPPVQARFSPVSTHGGPKPAASRAKDPGRR